MKKMLVISACMVALSAGGAFAQNQPAPGASSKGNVGPGERTEMQRSTTHMKKGTTTGMSRGTHSGMANPSSEGNVGPGTNNNSNKQPGGR